MDEYSHVFRNDAVEGTRVGIMLKRIKRERKRAHNIPNFQNVSMSRSPLCFIIKKRSFMLFTIFLVFRLMMAHVCCFHIFFMNTLAIGISISSDLNWLCQVSGIFFRIQLIEINCIQLNSLIDTYMSILKWPLHAA